jgi:hypothetical protein
MEEKQLNIVIFEVNETWALPHRPHNLVEETVKLLHNFIFMAINFSPSSLWGRAKSKMVNMCSLRDPLQLLRFFYNFVFQVLKKKKSCSKLLLKKLTPWRRCLVTVCTLHAQY